MYSITGATGYLAQALLRLLKKDNQPVTAVVREGSEQSLLRDYCSTIHTADLLDINALTQAFENSEVVIHLAAMVDRRPRPGRKIRDTNVTGTENVIEAARKAKVKKIIYVSCVEALNISVKRRPIREDFSFSTDKAMSIYGRTKAEATKLIRLAGMEEKPQTVTICPSAFIGPWDFGGGSVSSLIRRYLQGLIPACLPGGYNFVDVRDTARAIISAIDKGKSGDFYLVSGEYIQNVELLDSIRDFSHHSHRNRELPDWIASILARGGSAVSLMSRQQSMLSTGCLKILQSDVRVEAQKASEELGYKARPIRDSLRDTVKWLTENLEPEP